MPVSVHHPRYQALRAKLVAVRKTAELTQVQLAQRLGVGQSYVSKIERAEIYVDALVFIDWCAACGVSPGQVLDAIPAGTSGSDDDAGNPANGEK